MAEKHKPYWRKSRDPNELTPNYIPEWRRFRGFESQKALADAAGLTSQSVNRLESGTLAWTYLTLKALSQVLGCSMGDLISTNPYHHGERVVPQYKRPD